jgi:excisionase family DNA binding protein
MLTSKQLADQLHISAATIRLYARERLIPFSETPGGHRRFELDDVRAALALVRPVDLAPLSDDEAPRLADSPPVGFTRVHSWATITEADVRDASDSERGRRPAIPMVGEPGSSRFVVGATRV